MKAAQFETSAAVSNITFIFSDSLDEPIDTFPSHSMAQVHSNSAGEIFSLNNMDIFL
jgi:hypothetical protein